MDPLGVALGASAGAAATLAVSYVVFRRRGPTLSKERTGPVKTSLIQTLSEAELEKSKRETRTLLIEKDVLSGALTMLYEAEIEGKITKEERETLASRYREQLRRVDEKLNNVELIIEVGELEALKQELMNLFREKISAIEGRLEQTRLRLEKLRPLTIQQAVKSPPPSSLEEKPAIRVQAKQERDKEREKREPEEDRRVKVLKDEIFEALARLEQIDIER